MTARRLSEPDPLVLRFDTVERLVHWVTATLWFVLAASAALLYVGPLAAAFGRRELVRTVHVWAGLALVVPTLVGLAGPWGRRFRRDVGALNRFSEADRRWLRQRLLGGLPARSGRFHPGQKLNAAFVAGAGLVMLATGAVMRWFEPFPLGWRQGATFVHDWLALAFVFAVAGHVVKGLSDRGALRGMVTGRVRSRWARRHHPDWRL